MTGLAQLLHERGAAEDALAMYRQAFERDYVAATCSTAVRVHEWVPDLLAQERFEAAEAVLRELERQGEHMARIEEEYEARIREEDARSGVVLGQGSADWGTMVMTMVATAAVIPFLQTIMAKAGEDGYGAVRSAILHISRREVEPAEPDGQKNVIIHLPVNVPDDALRRLVSMDLAALMRASNATAIEVSWDNDQQEWKVVTRS